MNKPIKPNSHKYCLGSHDDLTGLSYIIVDGDPAVATLFTQDSQKIKGPPAENAPEALRKFAKVLQAYADKIKMHVHLAEGWEQSKQERRFFGKI